MTSVTHDIAKQLMRNDEFLKKTYGVGAKPYWRPPYAKHNAAVDAVAADVRAGVVSVAAARDDYRVIIDPASGEVDQAATARLRRKRATT